MIETNGMNKIGTNYCIPTGVTLLYWCTSSRPSDRFLVALLLVEVRFVSVTISLMTLFSGAVVAAAAASFRKRSFSKTVIFAARSVRRPSREEDLGIKIPSIIRY